MTAGLCRNDAERGNKVSWLDHPEVDGQLIHLGYAIDELAILLDIWIKIVAEAAINKDINHVGKSEENSWMKALEQQWQDILRTNTLKSDARAIPVFVEVFVSPQLVVEAIALRHAIPNFMDQS
jgi:hypothetical protein